MSNPVFSEKALEKERVLAGEPMTINGAINKTFLLLLCLIATSAYVWWLYYQGFSDKVSMLMTAGMVVSVIMFIVIMFNRKSLPVTAPIYALAEGLMIGGISAYFETAFPGIVIQAIGGTFAALFSLLILYRARIIRCSEKFRSVILISTLSVAVIYLVQLVGSFFGLQIPYIFASGIIGIGFSLLVVVIAALNLILDFDFIERGAQNMMDKNFEWYGAFGLLVTLVWLYIEILNLLSKLKNK